MYNGCHGYFFMIKIGRWQPPEIYVQHTLKWPWKFVMVMKRGENHVIWWEWILWQLWLLLWLLLWGSTWSQRISWSNRANRYPVSYTHLVQLLDHLKVEKNSRDSDSLIRIDAVEKNAAGSKILITVSYTHLDVYKRQLYICGWSWATCRTQGAIWWGTAYCNLLS